MKNIELEKLFFNELKELFECANQILESKLLEHERNEIKKNIFSLFQSYVEKGGDRAELMVSLATSTPKETEATSEIENVGEKEEFLNSPTPSDPKEADATSEIENVGDKEELMNSIPPSAPKATEATTESESVGDVVLIDKEHFSMGKDKISDFKIEDVLANGSVNYILQEGNTKIGSEKFPDPEKSRVANPRGILPCLTTGGSGLVDVTELETGVPNATKEVSEPANTGKKKMGRKGVPIRQFSIDGKFLKDWENATVAEHELKMSHQSIGQATRGLHKHKAGGYLWYRVNDPVVIENNAA